MSRPVIVSALTFCLSFSLQAQIPVVDEAELVPSKPLERSTEVILHILEAYHYKKTRLNDDMSSMIYDGYLEALDPNRSFFSQEDLRQYEPYRYQIDNALKRADLALAYEIFKTYRMLVIDRVDFARSLLDTDFDFTINETYEFDRRELNWAADKSAVNEIWRKRVKNDYLNLRLAKKDDDEIRETLGKRYERLKTSTLQVNANDIYQTFINAYTTAIEPHTSYFSPRTSENFDISMRLSLEGIGAVLRSENDYTTVQNVVPGGPADLSGQLHAEDRITGVGQDMDGEIVDVIGWRLDDVVDLIRGKKGTIVRLEVLPKDLGVEGATKFISITRDKIKLEEQAAKSELIDLPEFGGKVGVIDVPTFYSDFAAAAQGEKDYKSTTRDVRKILKELKEQDVDGIIIDLRSNGGGSLSEALEFTGLFIESGPVVQTKDSTGKIEINNDPDPGIAYSGPLAVLVDRNSASASEIYAGAIQDYRRGIIIGEPTFGKGTVQNIFDLNRLIRRSDETHGRLKTTIAQFFRISGGSNQHLGVVPDIVYPTMRGDDDHGERALDNALPWDRVKPARYIAASAPTDSFAIVRQRHEERIRDDELFKALMKQLDLAEEASSKTVTSLLESTRKEEREKFRIARQELENIFRIEQGLEPIDPMLDEESEAALSTSSETGTDKKMNGLDETTVSKDRVDMDDTVEEFEPKDVLLQEAAHILYDLLLPAAHLSQTAAAEHR